MVVAVMAMRKRLRGALLVLALLLTATAVVPLLLLGEAGDDGVGAVAAAPPFNASRVRAVSWKPRIFVYKGFLSDDECDHLVKLGKRKMQRSMVADNKSGKSVMSEVRTSSGMFLDKRQDPVVSRIEKRIAAWTFLPEENAENIQILRYEHGQKYEPHFDYFHDKVNQALGGHRYATVLMYLSTVEKGGETVFPNAEGWENQPKDDTFSECAQNGLAVKPVKGDAVLFFSLHIDGVPDPLSLHGSCPVIEGEKWSAPKWIRIRSYEHPPVSKVTEGCSDNSARCAKWAEAGECEKNPALQKHIRTNSSRKKEAEKKTRSKKHIPLPPQQYNVGEAVIGNNIGHPIWRPHSGVIAGGDKRETAVSGE
uniref:procollagen-proline 4-dioxygenase n=1 Tax=Oryza punctata TaxID=4537 RepID=A0A0E0LI55_ORYPU